jgi:hypothetical protein
MSLTLKEIKEAFPEGKQISARLIRENNRLIGQYSQRIKDIYKNKTYDPATKDFCIMMVQAFYLDKLLAEKDRLGRYQFIYSNKEYDNSNMEYAKVFPILELFTPEKVKRSSTRTFCCCPIHKEKTASFCIYHKTNTFYCFGCHAGGDSIRFVQLLHNLSFKDALKYMGK